MRPSAAVAAHRCPRQGRDAHGREREKGGDAGHVGRPWQARSSSGDRFSRHRNTLSLPVEFMKRATQNWDALGAHRTPTPLFLCVRLPSADGLFRPFVVVVARSILFPRFSSLRRPLFLMPSFSPNPDSVFLSKRLEIRFLLKVGRVFFFVAQAPDVGALLAGRNFEGSRTV